MLCGGSPAAHRSWLVGEWGYVWGPWVLPLILPGTRSRKTPFCLLKELLGLLRMNAWVISFTFMLCFKKEVFFNIVTYLFLCFPPIHKELGHLWSFSASQDCRIYFTSHFSRRLFPFVLWLLQIPCFLEPYGKAVKHETMFFWTLCSSLVLLMLWNSLLK